jgi:hypothetical protein
LISDLKGVLQAGSIDRTWDRWLKGNDPHLRLTFDPAAADEDRSATFITPTHPLVRQAAKALQPVSTMACEMSTKSSSVPPGRYPFAIYRWKVLGLTESFAFQPVSESEAHSNALLELLETSVTHSGAASISAAEEDRLEDLHYQVWMNRRGEHIESVTQSSALKLASLNSSHQARVALLEEQRDQSTDARIRRMKEGQLDAANRDFERRSAELHLIAGQADIVAEAAVLGVMIVEP